MGDTTRRSFLGVAGAGAAGLVIGGVAGAAITHVVDDDDRTSVPANASGPLLAYVKDVRQDQVSVLVGDHEVMIDDHEVVARLARALGKTKD